MDDARPEPAIPESAATPESVWGRRAVPAAWAIAAIGTVLVVAGAYTGRRDWLGDVAAGAVFGALGLVLAASVIGSMALQLASREPHGYVGRLSASIAGAIVIVALGALALLPVAW